MKLLFASILGCLCLSLSYAQESRFADDISIIKLIEVHLKDLDALLFEEEGIAMIQTDKNQSDSIKFITDFDKFVEMQKKSYNSKNGLTLQALYTNQRGLEIVDYSDEDNIYPYRNRFQLSLNWNIIESSLIGRKVHHQIFELEGIQNSFRFKKTSQNISKEEKLLELTKQWDSIISTVYLQRADLLDNILLLKIHLYSSHRVLYSAVSSVQMELYRVKSLISDQDTLTEHKHIQRIDLDSYLSDITTDTLGLFNRYMAHNIDLKQYPIERQILELNKRSLSYVKQMKIGVYTKMQYFGGLNGNKYNGKLDIGVSATFPLSIEHRRRKNVINYEISMSEEEQFYATKNINIKYKEQVERFTNVNNRLKQDILILKSIDQNIKNYRAMYQNNVSSFENLLFEYDAYLVVLANIYSTIKEREILIESLGGL